MKTIATIEGVPIKESDSGRVEYRAKAAIDADGANGQHGKQAAYMRGNKGSDYLANGGMGTDKNGNVVVAQSWAKNIVIMNPATGRPKEFPGGIIASKTTYRHRDKAENDPAAYVDSETVPYCVVPPVIRQKTKGIVLGCRARMTNTLTGQSVEGPVADIGPRTKIGELSIAAARAIGIPSSPRTGGTVDRIVFYEIFPGEAFDGYELQPA